MMIHVQAITQIHTVGYNSLAEDDYTCSVADFSGTFKGAMKGLDGKMIQPTNKKFRLEFCTLAHWKEGKILEERLFYDQMGMLKQIGAI